MSPEFTVLFLLFVAVGGCLSMFYDNIVRPVRRDEVRFELFALRDRLRWRAIMGEVDAKSPHYLELEAMLCRYIDFSHFFTWQRFMMSLVLTRHDPQNAEFFDFQKNAPKSLIDLHNHALQQLMLALRANSPVIHKLLGFIFGFMKHKARVVTFFCKLGESDMENGASNHTAKHHDLVRV